MRQQSLIEQPNDEVLVPEETLKTFGNPKAKRFFWDGLRFGVNGRWMGEIKILWFVQSEKTGRWFHHSSHADPESYETYLFSETKRVKRGS